MEKQWIQLFAEEEAAAAPEQTPQEVQQEAPAGDYAAMKPVLDEMASRLGVTPGDGEGLAQALRRQEEARGKEVMEAARAGADRIYDRMMQEAEQLKQRFPDFDLRTQLADPRFAGMLRSKVDMESAYMALHGNELIQQAMEYAARTVMEHMTSTMAATAQRPQENGLRSGGAVSLGSDVGRMSRKDYQAICKMVERGERVSFT